MINALTIDVEEWYHTNGLDLDPSTWCNYEDTVVENTFKILDILSEFGVQGTFFVLGCVAQKHPQLIKAIDRRGHEIGSHSGWHKMISRMNDDEFIEDLRFSKQVIEDITGKPVVLYRAPSWSLGRSQFHYLEILQNEGFICDSSLQPFRTPLSGEDNVPYTPFYPIVNGKKLELLEFPPTVYRLGKFKFPFSGGFYLRAVPYSVIRMALKGINRTDQGMIYLHPWEIHTSQNS